MRPYVSAWATKHMAELESTAQDDQITPGELVEIMAFATGRLSFLAFPEYQQPLVINSAVAAIEAGHAKAKSMAVTVAEASAVGETVQ